MCLCVCARACVCMSQKTNNDLLFFLYPTTSAMTPDCVWLTARYEVTKCVCVCVCVCQTDGAMSVDYHGNEGKPFQHTHTSLFQPVCIPFWFISVAYPEHGKIAGWLFHWEYEQQDANILSTEEEESVSRHVKKYLFPPALITSSWH